MTKQRESMIERLQSESFEVVVIGGGITGVGIALDAASRGMSVALLEMEDFAHGTSSRSTKLVHGGLRYLKQFEIKEVAELGRERAIVYENGPHVTTPVQMLLPFYKGGTFGSFSTSIGLKVYDTLAQVKKSERRTMLSRQEVEQKVPIVKKDGLLGGGLYVEYRTDDARLTTEVMKESIEYGAVVANYVKAEKFVYSHGKVTGVIAQDLKTKQSFEIKAKVVVNAAGPWVDEVREMDGSKAGKHLQLSKGVHLVFDEKTFPLQQAVYFDTPDGRMVFAIPRQGKTYVGTTDTFYEGDPKRMTVTSSDRAYILKAIEYIFPDIEVKEEDIESSWAGVRPLIHEDGKNPSEISRKDEIWVSESGLMTIAGGKLTGYRKMAETIVDRIVKQFKQENYILYTNSRTKHMPISGGKIGGSDALPQFIETESDKLVERGIEKNRAVHLVRLYGSNIGQVVSYMDSNDSKLPDDLYGQLMYAMEAEMAMTPVDFLLRRTGYILFNIDYALKWKDEVTNVMQQYFGWKDDVRNQYEQQLRVEIERATEAIAE